MKKKNGRLHLIVELTKSNKIRSQEELSKLLREHGHNVTQATLSRDLKHLKITKIATYNGEYKYVSAIDAAGETNATLQTNNRGFIALEFSGNLAVIHTRNGYASSLAYEIDQSGAPEIVGSLSGADTILVVRREGYTNEALRNALAKIISIDDDDVRNL